jgi:hypothetical protein
LGERRQRQETPINPAEVEAIALDAWRPERLWAGGNDRLMWSDDGGVEWRLTPRPLPEAHTAVHGIAASGDRIVLTTDRGIYRTVDAGETWVFMTDALPPHLQAGPVAVDLLEPGTLYAGFALVPYAELRQRAVAGGENTHMRDGAAGLAGAAALLAAAALAAVAALRRLWRRDRPGTVIGAGLPRASRKPIPSVLRQ